ncbi:hypothetical protein ACQY0O_001851 [Thecaphora frezii]
MTTTPLQNVVVVGAGAGIHAALKLSKALPATHRLVLIEANEVAFWPIGALRAAVEPGFEGEVVAPLDTLFKGSRHVVLPATRVVSFDADAVIVDVAPPSSASLAVTPVAGEGSGYRIGFDRCILALGATYAFPCRAEVREQAKILAALRRAQTETAAAQHILVVGGGPVGVEFIGELLERHPQKAKAITLVSRASRLVHDKLHAKLAAQLKARGVTVVLEDEVEWSDGVELRTGPIERGLTTFTTKQKRVEIQADYLLDATGGRPNTAVVAEVDASILDERGAIKVDETLRIAADASASAGLDWSRYLAIGDCNNFPCNKTYFAAEGQAKTAVENVLLLLRHQPGKTDEGNLKLQRASAPPDMMAVPLGKSGGATYLFVVSLGAWFTRFAKGKTLFVDKFKSNYV